MADKVEAFRELIEDRQEDINEAVETFREIGRALESVGRDARSTHNVASDVDETLHPAPPIQQPSPEEVAKLAVDILNSQSETPDESVPEVTEPAEESDEGYPWWLPWAGIVGVGVWGAQRKKA